MTRAITSYIAKRTTGLTSDNCISIQTITYVTKGLDLSNVIFCGSSPINSQELNFLLSFLETTR